MEACDLCPHACLSGWWCKCTETSIAIPVHSFHSPQSQGAVHVDLSTLTVDNLSNVEGGGQWRGPLLMDQDAFAAAVEVKGIGTDKPVLVCNPITAFFWGLVLNFSLWMFGVGPRSLFLLWDGSAQVYDGGSCLEAAWLWWALRVHGCSQVSVLSGGWATWAALYQGETEAGDPCCPLKLQASFEPIGMQDDLM